jgi:hypothetical protein
VTSWFLYRKMLSHVDVVVIELNILVVRLMNRTNPVRISALSIGRSRGIGQIGCGAFCRGCRARSGWLIVVLVKTCEATSTVAGAQALLCSQHLDLLQ